MARTRRKNHELAVRIGQVVRAQRKALGMTQAGLAEAIELETETISRMENGLRLPTIEKLLEMADVFQIPVAAFFQNVDAVSKQSDMALYMERFSVALEKLPESGKTFVLEVAQNYVRYHGEEHNHGEEHKPDHKKKGRYVKKGQDTKPVF
jgi:transcriptional regulator with XRE-family HTH domain